MKYFTNCRTLEELKKEYRRLCMIHHPDRGGDAATMAAINNEYDEAFTRMQRDGTSTGTSSTQATATTETPEAFRAVISRLIILEGIKVEICGSWIWVSGNTYPNREALKAAGLRYSKSNTAWYWRPSESAEYRSRGRSTMDEIRSRYGSQVVAGAPSNRITA